METNNAYAAIVIGASAGGFFAIKTLLQVLPENFPVPIIIVQHRSKDTGDLLEELLQAKCKIKIKQADEKEPIQKGVVYLAPPDYHLLVEKDHTFSLSIDDPVRFSRPSIDVLFESAASVYKSKLASIILTGSGDDGALGTCIVADNGGITIAQDPHEAETTSMPLASIETKKVKHVFTLAKIQTFLLNIVAENEKNR